MDYQYELQKKLTRLLKANQLNEAIELAEEELRKLPVTDFHKVLDRDLLNNLDMLKKYLLELDHNTENYLSSRTGKTVDTFMRINPTTFNEETIIKVTDWDAMEIKSIYCEMNGFYLNYDRWYIDLTVYSAYGGTDTLAWLEDDAVYGTDNSMVITGFEDLQKVFEDYSEQEKWKDPEIKKANAICTFLIVLRLQQLFRQAYLDCKDKNYGWTELPVLVTAHDMMMIYNATVE